MVQEYERAVIFRLGRLPAGGSKGPGTYIHATNRIIDPKTVLSRPFAKMVVKTWLLGQQIRYELLSGGKLDVDILV